MLFPMAPTVTDTTAILDQSRPPFLRQSNSAIKHKYFELQWQCRLAARFEPPTASLDDRTKNKNSKETCSIGPSPEDGNHYQIMNFPELRPFNRYFDISPFPFQRVPLHVSGKRNNYINASPIYLGNELSSRRHWIATQGPLENTVPDFWRMVHDSTNGSRNGPIVVVMLTRIEEVSGQEKCFPYFPTDMNTDASREMFNTENRYGDEWHATVTLKSQTTVSPARAVVRELELLSSQHASSNLRHRMINKRSKVQKLKVWHVYFSAWPDLAIPESRHWNALIRCIGLARHLASGNSLESYPLVNMNSLSQEAVSHTDMISRFPSPPAPTAPPTIVHCSAGVGRTGTYISLDFLITELLSGRLDYLAKKEMSPSSLPHSTSAPFAHSKSSSALRGTASTQSSNLSTQNHISKSPPLPPVPPVPLLPNSSSISSPKSQETSPVTLSLLSLPRVPPILAPVPAPRLVTQASSSALFQTAQSSNPRTGGKLKLPTLKLNTKDISPPRPRTAPYPQPTHGIMGPGNHAAPPVPTLPSAHLNNANARSGYSSNGTCSLEPDSSQEDGVHVPDEDDPVYVTVATLRKQRILMVQQCLQFELIYHLLRRLWIWRAKLGSP